MFDFLKKFIKKWFRNFLTFLSLSYFYPGFEIKGGLSYILTAGLLMAFVETFLKPLLKIMMIPVNIITFGMFSWLLTTLELLLVSYFMPFMSFRAYSFETFKFLGIEFGSMSVNLVFSVIIGTIFYNLINRMLKSLS